MLKNQGSMSALGDSDQIIPINGMLKNVIGQYTWDFFDQIIPINGMLKN